MEDSLLPTFSITNQHKTLRNIYITNHNMTIVISNSRVVDFYKQNPSLDPDEVNVWLIDMLEKVVGGSEKGTARSMMERMEVFFGDHSKQVESLSKELETQNASRQYVHNNIQQIGGAVTTMREDFKSLIVSQFVESQKDNERLIRSALEGAVEEGKQKEIIVKCINDSLGLQFENLAKGLQTPFTSLVSESEKRISDTLLRIHDNGVETRTISEKTCKDMEGYLAKYGRSKDKGNIGERKLAGLINVLYPTCELMDTTFCGGGKGDFIMRRPGKPQILFETKEYADGSKVPKKDVVKFLNDVKDNECCGVLVNHTGAITEKDNFYFEFHMGKVLLYIHDANYEMEKIDLAIRLIDYMEERMADINKMSHGGNVMSDEVMEQINIEFNAFNEHKERILSEARDFYNNTKKNLEGMQFSCLHKFLSTKYATEKSVDYFCVACNMGFKNNRALAAHKKSKSCKASINYVAPVVVSI